MSSRIMLLQNPALLLLIIFSSYFVQVIGHGYLLHPPSRSSAWRLGFKTPINYDDNALFCGGFGTQHEHNNGKCGICGDSYSGIRDNELPDGKYAKNLVITRTYNEGSVINSTIVITANHKGYFTFRICPATSDKVEVTQECLNYHQLKVYQNNVWQDIYKVETSRVGKYEVILRLPSKLQCRRCVIQWTYTAGNNWGICADGRGQLGCGNQETFRGCADVEIKGKNSNNGQPISTPNVETRLHSQPEKPKTTTDLQGSWWNRRSEEPKSTIKPRCLSTGAWKNAPGMDDWCEVNCNAGYCPSSHCSCNQEQEITIVKPSSWSYSIPEKRKTTTVSPSSWWNRFSEEQKSTIKPRCLSTGAWKNSPGMDNWCEVNCNAGYCPSSHCSCQ